MDETTVDMHEPQRPFSFDGPVKPSAILTFTPTERDKLRSPLATIDYLMRFSFAYGTSQPPTTYARNRSTPSISQRVHRLVRGTDSTVNRC